MVTFRSISRDACLAREFESELHLTSRPLVRLRRKMLSEAGSVSAGSKRTRVPAPLSRSDAENIPPVLNPDVLPSLAGSKRRKCYSECTDTHQRRLRAQVRDRCDQVFHEILGEDCKPVITFPSDDVSEDHLIGELLLIKDECNISGLS